MENGRMAMALDYIDETANPFFDELKKGLNMNPDLGCCVFKKCCKKYKRGKRCKKCPNR
ncbi:hypothetical protein BC792_102212 [Sphingobacterium allocomposti]|jgi:tRNA U34 2-thiouridine synthase MnmA/TrmU|uniref:Uncharacterized protein n=1 Tax=Sphingobacterium allocomposti TaxID=415956 RepID=A0A5S5DPB2_9SPHI|nr:hypothetical protein BC792_102212 [Sphingobacterium composti Yoo et al. 2007 non Ten et al. 2007]